MNEAQWLACDDPRKLLVWTRGTATDRKLRLFTCAFWRVWWQPLSNSSSDALDILQLLEYSEQWSEAGELPERIYRGGFGFRWHPLVARNAYDAADWSIRETAGFKSRLDCMRDDQKDRANAGKLQVQILRDIFGNPFHSGSIHPDSLTWQDTVIVRLAQAAYDERILPTGELDNARLLILADALEESGCTDDQILTHLRSSGKHYRGCWVIDLLLGKQ